MGTEENAAASANNGRSANDGHDDVETVNNEETRRRCKALAKSTGKRCKKSALPGSAYCPVHQRAAESQARRTNTERPPPGEGTGVARRPDPEWPLNDPTWRQQAFFMLFFGHVTDEHGEQVWHTCVYHDESGEQEVIEDTATIARKNFAGVVTDPWVDWILDRAELLDAAPPAAVTRDIVRVEILDADVDRSPVAPGRRLAAEVRFTISGPEAETLENLENEGIPFEILFRTVNCDSGAVRLVASERGRLKPEGRDYWGRQEFPIPVLGRYLLETIILLLPPGAAVAFRHRGPRFEVVPR